MEAAEEKTGLKRAAIEAKYFPKDFPTPEQIARYRVPLHMALFFLADGVRTEQGARGYSFSEEAYMTLEGFAD